MSIKFAYIASLNDKRSNTYALTNMMLDRLVEKNAEISYETRTPANVMINHCRGFGCCMMKRVCPQDEQDGRLQLKEKVLAGGSDAQAGV